MQEIRAVTNTQPLNYYELLQISPDAELETISRVYRLLAERYHPDNAATGDRTLYAKLTEAYQTLSDPEQRLKYDASLRREAAGPLTIFGRREFSDSVEGEGYRRLGILGLLYQRRRACPDHPGYSVLELESAMAIPREHLLFPLWYLRERGYVQPDEQVGYAITGDGVDYLEQRLPRSRVLQELLIPLMEEEHGAGVIDVM
jgi:curved DNA-binding protein